jgi:hypothetical protein
LLEEMNLQHRRHRKWRTMSSVSTFR